MGFGYQTLVHCIFQRKIEIENWKFSSKKLKKGSAAVSTCLVSGGESPVLHAQSPLRTETIGGGRDSPIGMLVSVVRMNMTLYLAIQDLSDTVTVPQYPRYSIPLRPCLCNQYDSMRFPLSVRMSGLV